MNVRHPQIEVTFHQKHFYDTVDLTLFCFHVTVVEHISASYQFVAISTLKKPLNKTNSIFSVLPSRLTTHMETLEQVFSCEFYKNFKNIFLQNTSC